MHHFAWSHNHFVHYDLSVMRNGRCGIYVYNGILLSHKKNEIMPFVATWLDLEVTILSKSEGERQIPYGITYRWNLKYDAQELICETEKDSQT